MDISINCIEFIGDLFPIVGVCMLLSNWILRILLFLEGITLSIWHTMDVCLHIDCLPSNNTYTLLHNRFLDT